MATRVAATTTTSSSATLSSSPPRWVSQSSRNLGERALPPPPRTFTPPLQTPPRIPEYHDELLVSKVDSLVGRALPSPPAPPQLEHHHENIYEEITDDFILKALNRNRIKMAQKSVPNREDDYGFVCQAPELVAVDAARKLNQNVRVPEGDMQTMVHNTEDNMVIPPDAKYNAPRSSARNFVQGCLSGNTLEESNLSDDQAFGFVRGCTKPQTNAMTLPLRADCLDPGGVDLRTDHQDIQNGITGYPPPPSYSQSQQPLQNFLPHCHPASQPEHYMCMTANSHMSQSSVSSLNPTSVLNVTQSSQQQQYNHHQQQRQQQSQHSVSHVSANPPLPPKLLQQTVPTPAPKYHEAPPPPTYPGTQHPALPPRQNQASMAQSNPAPHHPPPDYVAHLNQRPPLPNPRQNVQSQYPPNYPSNLLPSQSVPNLHSIPSSQLNSSSSLLSSSSSSTLSSHSQIFYTPGTQPPPRLRPCHTPTETDPTWCPYGSRPPSSLYMSDSSATYSAGSDSGISVCSERGHPLAASIAQMRPDHQRARTDLDCSRMVNQIGQNLPNERRHSLVNLNDSRCSEYLAPNCVHATDEGFSELHCYHQQLHQQQMQQHAQQQHAQQQQQRQQQHAQQHQQHLYEQHLQQQQMQKQIQEQRLQQKLQEQQIYKQHLQLQQQQEQEKLRFLQQEQQRIQQQQQQMQLQSREQQQLQEESNFVQRAREKIYQKLKHLDLAHSDYNQLEFSPVPWSPPPSEAPEAAVGPPPLPPPREPQVFKSISLSKGLQHLDPNVLTPSKEVPPPLPARLKRVHLSRKPLPVVPQEKEEEDLETKSCDVFEGVKPIEYKGDDIIGIAGGLDRLQVFHRQQGARKVIPRAHSTDTESEYGSRANSRDVRSSAKDKRSKADSRTKSKESRTKSKDSRSISKDTRDSARETTRASSSDRRSQSRRRRAKSLDKRSTSENKERRASSSSSERPPPPPLKTRHSSGSGKASRPPPLSVRNVSDSSYEERSPGVVNGTLSDLLRRNHDRLLLV